MHVIVLGILILRLQISVSFHMKNHMDFQKVGEVIFNNEKYNILKPTTHVLTDYFKDFMLRRENSNFPTKRVFIDHNGFRHAWSGFGEKIKSLRKTDHVNKGINDNSTLAEDKTESEMKENIKNNKTTAASKEQISVYKKHDVNSTENNDSSQKYAEDIETSNETSTSRNIALTEEDNSSSKTLSKIMLRDGKKNAKSTSAPATTAKTGDGAKKSKSESGRTIAQTTFFCPFFGVITMSAFID